MRTFKNETLIISKDAWKFLLGYRRMQRGYSAPSDESLEREWSRNNFRNLGASNTKHPITKNEIRIEEDTLGIQLSEIKKMLTEKGFEYRNDGFLQEGFNL